MAAEDSGAESCCGKPPVVWPEGHRLLLTNGPPASAPCGGLRPNRPYCRWGMGADILLGRERDLKT